MSILEDEFLSFLRTNFPHYNERMVTVPGESFQYKLPGNQHGIPNRAKEIRLQKMTGEKSYEAGSKRKACSNDEDYFKVVKLKKRSEKTESDHIHAWEKAASGQFAEQIVYDMLHKKFSNVPCLLVHEFKENDLVKVIKENIDNKKKENPKDNDITKRELKFFKLTNRNFDNIEKQITKMMESFKEDRFCGDSKPDILKKIEKDIPGFNLLTVRNKNNYMKNIDAFLAKKFKEGAQYTKSKLKDIILEHFLNLTYPNSEFDMFLFLKVWEYLNL